MTKIAVRNGLVLLAPGGIAHALSDAAAPNGIEFNATVTIRYRDQTNRYATVELPVASYAAYSALVIIWHATDLDGNHVACGRAFTPVSGSIDLGDNELSFGICDGLLITHYELCPIDTSNRMGFSSGQKAVIDEQGTAKTELGTPPAFTSALVEGEVFTQSSGTLINATTNTTVTLDYFRADDASGSNLVPVTVTALTAPAGTGGKYMRIRRTVTDPSVAGSLVDYSVWTFVAAAALDVALGTPPSFTSALTEGLAFTKDDGTVLNSTGSTTVAITYQQAASAGGTPSTLTPTGLTMPLTVDNFARIRREVDDPSLTDPLVDFSAWTPVTSLPSFGNAPSFTSTLQESAAFTKNDGTTNDTTANTAITISYEEADDNSGTNSAALTVNGLVMPATVKAFVRIKRVMTDPLLTSASVTRIDYSAWTACADALGTQPPIPVPTFGATISAYSGVNEYFRPVVTSFSGHSTGDQYEWTTSLLNPIPDDQTEAMQAMQPVSLGYQTQMDDPAKRIDPNTQTSTTRTDYSVFRFSGGSPYVLEEVKGQRLRFRRRRLITAPSTYGPWSEWSTQYTCPTPADNTTSTDWPKRWMPIVVRSKEAYNAKILDGPGRQFLRGFATTPANPNLLLAIMDQNFQWESDDFGETFYTPPWNGQFAGRQGVSCWIDPTDAKRQLMFYAVNPTGASTAVLNSTGVYLTTDGGVTCTQVLQTPLVRGTNTVRHNYQVICHKPGGTPTTRTVFVMANYSTSGSTAITSMQLYRSTDGGATFSARGSALSAATYASGAYGFYEIAMNPAGTLLHGCSPKGIWWSDDEGSTWTKATGIPGGDIHHIQYQNNGTCWIGTGAGLYRATNGKAFTQVGSFGKVKAATQVDPAFVQTVAAGGAAEVFAFAISPVDDNYIVAHQANWKSSVPRGYPDPIYSTNGGTSWSIGVSNPRLGQEEDGANSIGSNDHYGIVASTGSREKFFFHLGQHFGVSADHGQTINAAGMLFTGDHCRGRVGFHPSNWQQFAFGQQDTVMVRTANAGLYFSPDAVEAKTSGLGLQITTAVNDSTFISGAAAFMTPTGRVVIQAGQVSGNRVPVIEDYSGDTPSGRVITTALSGSVSEDGALDPYDDTKGYSGRYRLGNLGAAINSVTATQLDRHFASLTGAGGSTTLYGCDGSGLQIYRSTNEGTTYTLWRTASRSFRPVDSRPGITACPHANNRVYAVSGDGYVVRIVGTSGPTETTIFDARNYISGAPLYKVQTIAVDPFNADLGYISLYMWGCANVFRCRNLTTTTGAAGDWESIATDDTDGLPHVDGQLAIHPLTSELFFGSSHGSYVCKPPAGHTTTYGITNSVWDTLNTYFKTIQ